MPYWYWRPLKLAWALDENTDNTLDLPERGYLSALAIHSYATNETGLAEYDNKYPIQRHTKIRIVGNGNFEVMNLRAKHLQAINCWDWGINPVGQYSDVDTLIQRNMFYIPFGRYLKDPDYGLILENFASGSQLVETNNYSTTYHVDGSSKLDVYGLFYKEPTGGMFGKGFLKKRQVYDRDTASATQFGVKLPTDKLLRQIHLFSEPDLSSRVDATSPVTNVQYIWLGIKSKEEYILENVRSLYFSNWIHDIMGRQFETVVNTSVGTTTAGLGYSDTMLYRAFNRVCSSIVDTLGDHNSYTKFDDRRICQVWFHAGASADTVGTAGVYSKGVMLHGDIPLLMVDPFSEQSEWLDAKALADVYLEVTEGASTGNWYAVLDELESTYG